MNARPDAAHQVVEIDPADDPRVWLEEVEGEAALEWAREENARTFDRLRHDPRYEQFFEAALTVHQSADRIPYGSIRGDHVYNFWEDADHRHGLWRRASLDSYLADAPEWETLLDLDALAEADGVNWVWGGADCAPDETPRCMITLSDGGKDAAFRREFDLESRRFVADGFATPEAKGGTAWLDADTLLVYLALDPEETTESGYPFVIRRWARGAPLDSATEVVRGAAQDVGVWGGRLEDTTGAVHMYASQARTFFETTEWLLPEEGAPIALPLPDRVTITGLFEGQLVFSIDEAWTVAGDALTAGSVLSFDLDAFLASGELPEVHSLFVPGPRESVRSAGVADGAVLLAVDENVSGRLQAYRFIDGAWRSEDVATPDNLSLRLVATDAEQALAFMAVEGFLTPPTLYQVDSTTAAATPITAAPHWFDSDGLTVEQHEARSPDGTAIPYFLIRHTDAPATGDTPVLLYGYGGFQITVGPSYSGVLGRLWLEQGGAYAVANIRGGGEFGPDWHQAGLKTRRQRIYDDMIAVAEQLIEDGITRPGRLGVDGRSNGGLLTGVMYTQRPDLWGGVISGVPLLDMLRYHRLLAGASWMGEYGDPNDPEEGAFLRSISPYHNVARNADYPEIYLYTSTKDDRVHPGHARKFAHLLAELGHPYLYWENIEGGHAGAANREEVAHRDAMLYLFMVQRLMDNADA